MSMSKIAAIDVAVRIKLAEDGRTLSYADPLNKARSGYTDTGEIREFLLGVAKQLRLDTPMWIFDWSGLNPADLLTMKLYVVHSLIEEKTRAGE